MNGPNSRSQQAGPGPHHLQIETNACRACSSCGHRASLTSPAPERMIQDLKSEDSTENYNGYGARRKASPLLAISSFFFR